MSDALVVRGHATAEELAVVLAIAAARGPRTPAADPYTRWRATRLAALTAPR